MNYWVVVAFIIIASIFRSSSGKGAKNAPKTGGGSGMDANERQELERHIREIMRQQPDAGRVATAPSLPSAGKMLNKPVAEQKQNKNRSNDVRQQSFQQGRDLDRKQAKPVNSSINDGDLTKQSSELSSESIMSDFSIEKAVIYSEILEPKFKQY